MGCSKSNSNGHIRMTNAYIKKKRNIGNNQPKFMPEETRKRITN